MKETKKILGWVIPIGLIVGLAVWVFTLPKKSTADLISADGIHHHVTLLIKVNGQEVPVPGGIGLGAIHNPLHTHEADNVLHLEFGGVVRAEDILLGKFFEVWGKDFSKASLLGNVAGAEGAEGAVRMLVNGTESFEFEKYMMQDGDKIELSYESR